MRDDTQQKTHNMKTHYAVWWMVDVKSTRRVFVHFFVVGQVLEPSWKLIDVERTTPLTGINLGRMLSFWI